MITKNNTPEPHTYKPLSQWLSRLSTMPIMLHQKKTINSQQLKAKVAGLYEKLEQHSSRECILLFHDCYYFIVALLAALHAGKTPILLGHNNLDKLRSEYDGQQLILTDHEIEDNPLLWSIPQRLSGSTLLSTIILPAINPLTSLVLYTSGSSGEAKKIVKTVQIMDTEVRWLAELWQNEFNATQVKGSVSHHHLYGLTFRIWLPLSMGYLIDTDIVEFPEQLNDHNPFVFITSPAFLQYVDTVLPTPSWTFILSAGGVLNRELAEKILDWSGKPVREIYGSTETGVIAHREQCLQQCSWSPFPELSLTSQGDQRYQLNSPLLSSDKPFLLDDKLSFTQADQFELLGRIDKIIKIGEKRISITDIENRLRQFDFIYDAAVIPIQRNNRTYLGAVIETLPPIEKLTQQQISIWRQELKKFIDPIAIPRFWRQVTKIPLNNQSKRCWSQLQELFNVSN